MKTIYKIWLLVIVIALTQNLASQEEDRLVRFGVIGGLQISTISGEMKSESPDLGFNIGATMDYGRYAAYMKLSLILQKTSITIKDGDNKQKANLMYVRLPIHIGYRIGLGESTRLVFSGGPYVAYGLSGKWTGDGGRSGRNVFSGNSFIKFDYGLGITAAVEFNKFVIETGGTFGIPNINNESFDKQKTQSYHLSLGYKF